MELVPCIQDLAHLNVIVRRKAHCRERLESFLSDQIPVIEELEENNLPEFSPISTRHNNWAGAATVNVISHGVVSR